MCTRGLGHPNGEQKFMCQRDHSTCLCKEQQDQGLVTSLSDGLGLAPVCCAVLPPLSPQHSPLVFCSAQLCRDQCFCLPAKMSCQGASKSMAENPSPVTCI